MQFLSALLSLDPSYLAVAGMAILVLFGAGASSGSSSVDEDDAADFDNASWNPSSVNYND